MWILMLAIFIASIGLNVNSTAVIIGAMLVSPLMSGIMSMGYSLAVRDLSLLQKAAMRFGTQVIISLIASTVYFMISPLSEPTSEMIARTSPTLWDVLIALFGGIAGMIGNTRKVKGNVTLLIIGVMIGYLVTAIVGVLKFFSAEEDIKAYVVWGLGSFARVSGEQMLLFVGMMLVLLPLSFLLVKTLNLMLLGDDYARNLGLNVSRSRTLVILNSGVLVAIVTAYCGPIMFIGLAVPHLCRAMFKTSDHRILVPGTILTGAALALLCSLVARMPGFEGALPVNSVTALIGAPVIASVIFKRRKDDVRE